MSETQATVVIPNYNGRRFLPRLMASLADQTERRFDVIVVDDGSADDGVSYLGEAWPDVQVICNPRNLGFAGTCNAGIRAAATPFVVLLNNDTHLDPAWMAEGLRPFADAGVGAVASLVLLADAPHPVDTAGDVYSVAGGAVKRGHLGPREAAEGLPAEVFSPSGVSAFYRREALDRVGLLDERFVSYYEDVDLGFRLAWAGYRCRFAPRSVCFHHLSSSYSSTGWGYHFNSARNAEIVWWANLPRRLRWRYLPAHVAFSLMQCGHKVLQGVGPAYVCGKMAALGRLGHIAAKRRQVRSIRTVGDADLAARLERDWWGLHVRARRRAVDDAGGEAAADRPGGGT